MQLAVPEISFDFRQIAPVDEFAAELFIKAKPGLPALLRRMIGMLIEPMLKRVDAAAGSVLLHGFSRGSTNVYAVAALDAVSRNRFFSYVVANAGGAAPDYPPTRRLMEGAYGDRPYAGQRWITACSARDPDPDRDGCPAMQSAASLVRKLGGDVVLAIADAQGGHGAFHRNPANVERVLALFVSRQ